MAGNTATPGVSVASRLLALLGAFDDEHRQLTLTQLADRAGLSLATAHRLVGELVDWGALTRRPSGEYVVGRRLWELGLLAPAPSALREVLSPFLHDVYGATLATVHLGVREGTQVLYLARLSGNQSIPILSTTGSRLPLHSTGVGKVLLAHAPDEVQEEVLAHLTRVTPYTVTHATRLRTQLKRVRQDGYAQTSEEMSLGACSLAVPVWMGDTVVASVGVVVPSLDRDKARLLSALKVAGQGMSRSLR